MRFCTRGTRDKTGERRISSRTGTNRKMPNITTRAHQLLLYIIWITNTATVSVAGLTCMELMELRPPPMRCLRSGGRMDSEQAGQRMPAGEADCERA